MQTSSRVRDTGPSFAARRGHIPQISINDDSHHVTEAIGYMYGDEEDHDARRHARTSGGYGDGYRVNGASTQGSSNEDTQPKRNSIPRKQLPERRPSGAEPVRRPSLQNSPFPERDSSWGHTNGGPSIGHGYRNRTPSETATSAFPLNDIDYESSPAAVAQELSNLQALRRMSMDVAAAGDPDLPTLNPAAMPASPSLHEDDTSRLYWVPAGVHPELAPKEFKSFLESKAEQIKRRSGELSSFSQSSSRSSSLNVGDAGSLRRKKSMLSRQINSPAGYQDGAERLERKRSLSKRHSPLDPNLQDLEALVSEPVGVQETSQDTWGQAANGDVILPSIPGSSLKRSTRTTYRRGGSMKGRGDRPSYAQRAAKRAAAAAGGEEGSGSVPTSPEVPPLPSFSTSSDFSNLAQTLRDPNSTSSIKSAPNFSRPAAPGVSSAESTPRASFASTAESLFTRPDETPRSSTSSAPDSLNISSTTAITRRRSPETSQYRQPIPQIVEVPPVDDGASYNSTEQQAYSRQTPLPQPSQTRLPERTSSREDPQRMKTTVAQRPPMPPKQSSSFSTQRLPLKPNVPPSNQQQPQSIGEMSSHPSPLPGNDTNTNNLSFIPTLTEDKRADYRKTKDKKDDKKSTWGWLLGKEEAEKEKPRAKSPKSAEKHDNARLDVLQTSIEGNPKGRESLVLDRDSLRLDEERKKESQRKSIGSDTKKEKEGLFSSIFGGKKSKVEKESTSKKNISRGLSPEPPYRELKADIDYNWTRFSILEERAIYRMAHIKLANPRRALYSQVLLSNFMYSYLAKVQQMHPQMNLPTSAKQQKKQQQQQTQQPDEYTQYQRYQEQQQQEQGAPQQNPAGYSDDIGYEADPATYEYSGDAERPLSRGSKSNAEDTSYGHPEDQGGYDYGDQDYGGHYGYNNNHQPNTYGSAGGRPDQEGRTW